MNYIKCATLLLVMTSALEASAQESGRIKKKPPTAAEAERIASEQALNDGILQQGDIVATDRGFFLFRGLSPDGAAGDFVQVPNPLSGGKPNPH
jgi:hypothetical protein